MGDEPDGIDHRTDDAASAALRALVRNRDQATQDRELAIEIADRARRHRFFSTLPLGGRLLALRWILEGPDELLDKQQTLQRQDLLARFPKYDALSQRIKQLHTELAQLPPVPEAEDDKKKQAALSTRSARPERRRSLSREIAVRREPADMVFPPLRKTKDIQRRCRRTLAVGVLHYHAWHLRILVLEGKVRRLAHYGVRRFASSCRWCCATWAISSKITSSAKPRSPATAGRRSRQIRDMIFDKSTVDLSAKIDELVIVPDGIFWYVPWEALPVGDDDAPLMSRTKIRYAPTVGLSLPYSTKPIATRNVGVVVGKLFPQDKPEVSQAAFEKFSSRCPMRWRWRNSLLPLPRSIAALRPTGGV